MGTNVETPLRGAVCIVTGGGSGIGRALCLLLGSEGAKVVVVGRTAAKLDAVAAEIHGQELRNTGIRTCVVFPGEVDTPILDQRPHPPAADARATMVTSEDVAQAIAFVLRMPARATISELVVKPTLLRNAEPELEKE